MSVLPSDLWCLPPGLPLGRGKRDVRRSGSDRSFRSEAPHRETIAADVAAGVASTPTRGAEKVRGARPSPDPSLVSSRLLSWGGRSRSGTFVLLCDLACMPPRPPLRGRIGRGRVSFRVTFGARPPGLSQNLFLRSVAPHRETIAADVAVGVASTPAREAEKVRGARPSPDPSLVRPRSAPGCASGCASGCAC